MLKETTYKEKFSMLSPWMPLIIEEVKRDLKNEHMKSNPVFVRHYFAGKNLSKITLQELVDAYTHAVANQEDAEDLADYITNRWLLKHADLYMHFEQALMKINPNFSDLDLLDEESSLALMEGAIKEFGAPNTYLFCVLNSVVFPEKVFTLLAKRAEHDHRKSTEEAIEHQEKASIESMQRNYEQQIARLTDKYEKKLAGLQKKYSVDIEALKKQVANLQRKLTAS